MKRIFSLTLAFVCCAAGATGVESRLGSSFSEADYGSSTSSNPISTTFAAGDFLAPDPLATTNIVHRLQNVKPDEVIATRGVREVQIYSTLSPSVVLVLTPEGHGSGSIISEDGKILTSWHVIKGYSEVGVVFKPRNEGKKFTKADIYRARVIREDQITDLALLQLTTPLAHLKAIPLGSSTEIQVGSDVHAIGHPTGESWSYTKGIVSQIRAGYEWKTEAGVQHIAKVVQTQTPISPGSSGGPLITDSGHLIGVNSFKAPGEAINFAVSVDEVQHLLLEKQDRLAKSALPPSQPNQCEVKTLYEGRNKKEDAYIGLYDTLCSGKPNRLFTIPDDKTKPVSLEIDSKSNGITDIIILSLNRDGKWDISYWDIDGNGKPGLIGHHPDGKIKPSWFEPYVASR